VFHADDPSLSFPVLSDTISYYAVVLICIAMGVAMLVLDVYVCTYGQPRQISVQTGFQWALGLLETACWTQVWAICHLEFLSTLVAWLVLDYYLRSSELTLERTLLEGFDPIS
jgi:hypothetical protein